MSSGEHGPAEHGHTEDGTGRLPAGRYRVTARLGRGGMGVVWRALDEVLGREVAVKELRTCTGAAGPELSGLRLRMQREARAAARVRHPGVVAVHDVAEDDGRPLIVMELIDGPSLDGVLRERGTLDPYEAARIGAAGPTLPHSRLRSSGRCPQPPPTAPASCTAMSNPATSSSTGPAGSS